MDDNALLLPPYLHILFMSTNWPRAGATHPCTEYTKLCLEYNKKNFTRLASRQPDRSLSLLHADMCRCKQRCAVRMACTICIFSLLSGILYIQYCIFIDTYEDVQAFFWYWKSLVHVEWNVSRTSVQDCLAYHPKKYNEKNSP